MNRRSFFNKLSSAVVGCYLAVGIEFKKKEPEINPDWVNAEYEFAFISHQFESKQFLFVPTFHDFIASKKDALH